MALILPRDYHKIGAVERNRISWIEPEQAKSYEVGAKWNLFEDRLQLNAAIFRNERSNYRVASNDPTLPDPVLDGKSRVDGLALGASGEVSDRWTIFANYTYLDSEVLQNISDRCRDNPAAAGCGEKAVGCGEKACVGCGEKGCAWA